MKRQNYNICFERLLQTSLQHILTGIQSICGHNMPILCQHPGQFRLTAVSADDAESPFHMASPLVPWYGAPDWVVIVFSSRAW